MKIKGSLQQVREQGNDIMESKQHFISSSADLLAFPFGISFSTEAVKSKSEMKKRINCLDIGSIWMASSQKTYVFFFHFP